MPLELRRWLQILTAGSGVLAACACWYVVDPALNTRADSVRLPLLALTIGSVVGFGRLLGIFLPLILTKIWPRLDRLPN